MSNTKPGSSSARRKKRVVWFKKENTPPPMETAFRGKVQDDTDPSPSPAWNLVRELAEAERWLAAGNGSKELRKLYERGYLKTSLELYRQERAAKKTRR